MAHRFFSFRKERVCGMTAARGTTSKYSTGAMPATQKVSTDFWTAGCRKGSIMTIARNRWKSPGPANRFFYMAAGLAVLFLMTACATSLEAYKPHSAQEAGVRDTLLKAEAAWNRQDVAGFAALLDKHATFTLKRDGRVVDKQTFVKALPQKMKAHHWNFGPPKITFRGRKAFVYLSLKTDPEKPVLFFTLRRRDNRWRILAIR